MAEPDPAPNDSGKRNAAGDSSPWSLLALGLQLTVAMCVAVALGQWVDNRLGWSPWGTLGISMAVLSATLYVTLKDVLK
jgi:hypothetical protein